LLYIIYILYQFLKNYLLTFYSNLIKKTFILIGSVFLGGLLNQVTKIKLSVKNVN